MAPAFGSQVPIWLDGQEVKLSGTYDVVSPVTGEVIYQASSATVEDAEKAVQSAAKALEAWSATKPSFRRDILLRAADELAKQKDALGALLTGETGAADSMFQFEFNLATECLKTTAGLISAVRGTVPTVSEEGKSAIVYREPYGVVLSIAPWNAPYILGFRACLGPLAMGNTVVLKGSEMSPGVYWAIASALHAAGLPPGVLNTIVHKPADAVAVTTHLIESPHVRKINFTGSTNTGAIIASQAAKLLKPTLMELGGKAPTIVCEDADIQQAALGCALGAFLHSGQICMATERILAHKAIAEPLVAALKAVADQIFGAPDGLVLVNEASVQKNRKLIDDAVAKGARISYNADAARQAPAPGKGAYMRPLIVEDVKPDMNLYYTESFGPSVSVFVVDSDEQAIQLANDTEYGLAAAVFTEDLRRGLRIAKKLQSGAVHINSMSVHDESALPHGGFKKSGFGRFNSVEGLEEWVQTKVVTWKD